MITIAERTHLLDLDYLGRPRHIATCVLESDDGLALVDPGPATTLDHLRDALTTWGATLDDVRHLLITHIHLDHSGGAGRLAAELPALAVHVHERGAVHLADPTRLLDSATRIYGDRMAEFWGTVEPVPADRIRPVAGGETLRLGRRELRVAYTPGHASHHVAWFDVTTGIAFTGDVTGEQLWETTEPIPVTPPPDIDVEQMLASGDRILAWRPGRLFLTHFGPAEDPPRYIAAHGARLQRWSELVRASLQTPGSDEARARECALAMRHDLEAALPPAYHEAISDETLEGNWGGLARYHRRGKSEK